MANLKVPSAQHLARNWRQTPAAVQKDLVRLVKNPPTFSYQIMFSFVRDILLFGVPQHQIENAIRKKVKRADIQANFLELLPLIVEHFSSISPKYVLGVERRYYSAGRGLMVPFDPPIIYGGADGLVFPWFSFWKNNPLEGERLSLFVTMIHDIISEDPDLEIANFQILDFSAPPKSKVRNLGIILGSDIPLLTEKRKREMLEIFAEGYFGAADELKKQPTVSDTADDVDPSQYGLFD